MFALTLTTQRQDDAVGIYEKKYKNYKDIGIQKHLSKYIEGVFYTDVKSYRCFDTSTKAAIMKTFTFTIRK